MNPITANPPIYNNAPGTAPLTKTIRQGEAGYETPSFSNLYTPSNIVAPTLPTTLTSDMIVNPAPQITFPNQTAGTAQLASAGIQGTTQALQNGLQPLIQQQDQSINSYSANASDLQTRQNALIAQLEGKSAEQAQLENNAGIPQLSQTLNDATNELNTKQLAFRHQEESIYKDSRFTREAAQAQVGELSRQHNSELADIAVRQSVASGNLATAQQIIAHKIDVKYGDLKDLIGFQQKFLDQNDAKLSDAQKTKLQLQITNNTRQYEQQTSQAKALEDAKLDALKLASKNGADTETLKNIQSSTSAQNAVVAMGEYAYDPLDKQYKQAQISNIYSDIADKKIKNNLAYLKLQQDANGSTELGTLNGKPQNVAQTAANGYADRIAQADVILGTLGNKFTGKFAIGGSFPNALQSGDRQAYEQAKKNFATAVLRRESGASISPTEFITLDSAYFPQPGDKPDVLKNKESLRNTVINNFYREANVARPVLPGMIVEANGKHYKVGLDGESLEEVK